MKKWILISIRLFIAAAALYIASRRINWQELLEIKWGVPLLWLLPALFFYNASQFVSAFRLLRFYRLHQPSITYLFNLRLYYMAMFYNLFLPGGIGGDAYKIITLKNSQNTYRELTIATLLDRVTGLIVLVTIITVLSMILPLPGFFQQLFLPLPYLVLAGWPVYFLIIYYFFKPYHKVLPVAAALSIVVQLCQLLSFYCIVLALQGGADFFPGQAFLFYNSSVIAALPISIGGIGTRELSLATGAGYFGFSAAIMVSASLLFFMVVVISSMIGWGTGWQNKK